MSTESLHLVTTKDGEKIAVWHLAARVKADYVSQASAVDNPSIHVKAKSQNILLIHGTFSDKRVSLGIAGYLAKLGHNCYIMEWRGHGTSSTPKDKFNFETVAFYDIEASLHYLFEQLKLDNLHVVTHSGGGIGLTMCLTQNQHYINKISSISMVACQAYGAVLNRQSYSKIFLLKTLTRWLNHLPAKRLKLGPINESYYTMSQWYNWNLNKNFHSNLSQKNLNMAGFTDKTDFDYRLLMPSITIPIYAISAKGDHFIAPPSGCQLFLNDFNNPANAFREFSSTNGDLEDYNHSRVILSSNAAKEIWPTIAAWIEQHKR